MWWLGRVGVVVGWSGCGDWVKWLPACLGAPHITKVVHKIFVFILSLKKT